MATYGVDLRNGLARNGSIPFTGWTPILTVGQPVFATGQGNGVVQFNGQSQNDDRLSKQFRKLGPAIKILKTIFNAQIGNVVGVNTGPISYKRVLATNADVRPAAGLVETITQAGRGTTTADIAAFRGMISRAVAPTTYPKDVSGNGGGGKVKF